MGDWINGSCRMIEQEMNTSIRDLFFRSMSQAMPIWDFTAQVKRQAAQAIIGETVGNHDRHVGSLVDCSGSQCRTDARITAANDQHPGHHDCSLCVIPVFGMTPSC